MSGLIDIHCHILPGIDDGPKSIEESIEMARRFESAGFEYVVATPHYIHGTAWSPSPQKIRELVLKVQSAITAENISLTILPGMEVAFDRVIFKNFSELGLLTVGESAFFLIEPSFDEDPSFLTVWIKEICDKSDFNVILAHPERITPFQKDFSKLVRLSNLNIFFQLNIGSLLGYFGAKAEDTALKIVNDDRFTVVLGTDAHRASGRTVPGPNDIKQLEYILNGKDNLKKLLIDNPKQILNKS